MEEEFTLKSVVDFMEARGFHVKEAEEIHESRLDRNDAGAMYYREGPLKIVGVRLTVTPKDAG